MNATILKLLFWGIMVILFAGCNSGNKKAASEEAVRVINEASKQKDYKRALSLADSLGKADVLSMGESYYWQGYAYYRMMQPRTAEFYWKEALIATDNSTNDNDLAIYARSASYLVSSYIRYLNYSSALKMVKSALNHLDRYQYTTSSDYTNLLIFAGCCQAHFNAQDSVVNELFERAYQQHMDNVNKQHSKESYRDAMVGFINITYNLLSEKRYAQGLIWAERLGMLIDEYKHRFADDEAYIDKQWARYQVFSAIGLEGTGKQKEAIKAFTTYQQTQFAHTPEGQLDASDYHAMSGHWKEAVDNLHDLDELFAIGQSGFSIEDIQKYLLRKYHANLMAG